MNSDDKPAVSRESDKFMLRLPDGMRAKIAELAKANNRSMNAEIVARLEASFLLDPHLAALTDRQRELRALIVEEVENYLNYSGKRELKKAVASEPGDT